MAIFEKKNEERNLNHVVLETLLGTRQNNEAASASGDVKPPLAAAALNHQLQPAAAAEAAAAVRAATVQQHVYAAAAPPQAAAAVQTVVQTNPDGTISLIQVDPANPIITLPDGTQAQVSYRRQFKIITIQLTGKWEKRYILRNES